MKFSNKSLNGAMATDWPITLSSPPGIEGQRRIAASNAAIASKLKKIYGQVLSEPLPDNLSRLLDQLDRRPPARDEA